jgi:hypothetical protein
LSALLVRNTPKPAKKKSLLRVVLGTSCKLRTAKAGLATSASSSVHVGGAIFIKCTRFRTWMEKGWGSVSRRLIPVSVARDWQRALEWEYEPVRGTTYVYDLEDTNNQCGLREQLVLSATAAPNASFVKYRGNTMTSIITAMMDRPEQLTVFAACTRGYRARIITASVFFDDSSSSTVQQTQIHRLPSSDYSLYMVRGFEKDRAAAEALIGSTNQPVRERREYVRETRLSFAELDSDFIRESYPWAAQIPATYASLRR